MASALGTSNASIIIALRALGIHMDRDEDNLSVLTSEAQNTRLQKSFDRAIEDCCVLSLLFAKEELAAPRHLVLSSKPQWTGWKDVRTAVLHRLLHGRSFNPREPEGMRAWIKAQGDHTVWGPFRMGRYSFEDSVKYQGASVRRRYEVAEMETLIMRWLTVANLIDMQGDMFPGQFWAITDVPAKHNGDNAHLPRPPPSQACLALEVLDVIEMQLPQDIDTKENETGEPEMKAGGYVGNANRRAVPVIVVRYATSLPGLGTNEAVRELISHKNLPSVDPVHSYLTPAQHALFSRLLESNHRRLSSSEIKKYQSGVPSRVRSATSVSFFSPIYCPSLAVADEIELGRKSRLACAVCDVNSGDMKLFYCSGCSGISYCSAEHQASDWPAHKAICRLSKTIEVTSALEVITLPLHEKQNLSIAGASNDLPSFISYHNPIERLKPPSRSSARSRCAKTIYAPGERFIVRARWGGNAGVSVAYRRATRGTAVSTNATPEQTMWQLMLNVIHVLDRPGSFSILLQKRTGTVENGMLTLNIETLGRFRRGVDAPAAQDNTVMFQAVVDVILRVDTQHAESAYFWAKRKGDCIEIDMVDIPRQSLGW